MASNALNLLRMPLCLLLAVCLGAAATGQAVPVPVPDRAPAGERAEAPRLLNDDEINQIKIYEVVLSSRPRISFEPEDLQAFLLEYAADDRVPKGRDAQRDFLRAEGYQQLALIFAVRARNYYGKATMRGEPESLRNWHRTVQQDYIQEYFRPMFGVGQVEALYLFDRGRDQERISYTNFFILTQVRVGGVPMIDRDRPEESLILQWGLPRASAKFPAPEDVPNWQPYFRDTEDPRFQRILEVIKSLIADNRNSNYGLDYPVPNFRKPAGDE